MEFADPKWLSALYATPLLAALFVYGARRRRRDLLEFAGPHLHDSLAPGRSWRKILLKSTLKIAGFVLLALALARPQFGKQLVKVEREGIDLVIALDTSLSMLAEDMKPNRLERAKQEIVDLIRGLKGDRVGLVVFAGDAFVLCPLTVDYDAALMFVQTADVDMISRPGTALDKAIDTSAALFQKETKSDRVVILVTDGEGHAGDPVGSARRADEKGIRIYTIGIGNPAGELIPLRGTDGSVSGYKKDKSGETVLTRLDEKTLRLVADATGGKFLPATRQGLELKVLYREMSGMDKTTIEGEFVERKSDRFGWFLAASFMLLGLEATVTRRGSLKHRRRRALHTGVLSLIALTLLLPQAVLAGGIDRGRVKSGNEYYEASEFQKALLLYRQAIGDTINLPRLAEGVLYNQANSLHMMGKYEEALSQYNRSFASDSLSVGRVFYNRGNTLVRLGKLQDAIESYVRALQFLPDDEDARHNLELALKQMEQQEQQQKQQQKQQKQQNNDQDQKQDKGEQQQSEGDQAQGEQQNPGENQQRRPNNSEEQPDSSQMQQASQGDSTGAEPQQQQVQSIKLSREDALRILKLLEEQEKQLQKARRKAAFKRIGRSGKDW